MNIRTGIRTKISKGTAGTAAPPKQLLQSAYPHPLRPELFHRLTGYGNPFRDAWLLRYIPALRRTGYPLCPALLPEGKILKQQCPLRTLSVHLRMRLWSGNDSVYTICTASCHAAESGFPESVKPDLPDPFRNGFSGISADLLWYVERKVHAQK